jgi:hypothetical protein
MTMSDVVSTLMHEVPEFAASFDADKALSAEDRTDPYIVFGEFGSFLRTVVPQRSLEDPTVLASFRLLTALAGSENPEVYDLVSAGTLELLLDTPETIRAARQLLYGRALDAFEELVRQWGVDTGPP